MLSDAPRRDGDASAYRRSARLDAGSPREGQALTPLPVEGDGEGDDASAGDDLEELATTPARFGQLLVYAFACLLCSFDWNIMVRRPGFRPSAAQRL